MFSFTTTPTCVEVTPSTHTALFGYTVPADAGHLPSQAVAVKVFDGGSPGRYDRYEHKEAVDLLHSCQPQNGAYYPAYPIQAGNLVVHAA